MWSVAAGVALGDASETVFRLLSVFPAGLYSSVPGEPAIGVGHPAYCAATDRFSPACAPRATFFSLLSFCSIAVGVGHPVNVAACPNVSPNPLFPYFAASSARRTSHVESVSVANPPASGVGQPTSAAVVFRFVPRFAPLSRFHPSPVSGPRSAAEASGVGHPEDSLSEVRRPDAVCAQYDRPDGVALSFQVC